MGTNALRLLKQIELLYQEKHLPGRHNQKMHAPLKYLRGSGKVEINYVGSQYSNSMEAKKAILNSMRTNNISENDIRRMVSLKGLNAEIHIHKDATHYDDGIRIRVTYTDSNGTPAGEMVRIYGHTKDNKLVAYNDTLYFFSENQNNGYATTLYANQIMTLKDRNYDHIKTFANSSVGRYAWARKGFDYASDSEVYNRISTFHNWVEKHNISEPINGWPQFKHAKDFADLKVPGVTIDRKELRMDSSIKGNSFDTGKAFMLDNGDFGHWSWDAILRLKE